MRLGKVRLEFQCPAATGDGFLQFPAVLEDSAQVVVGRRIVRLEFQCPAVASDRLVPLPPMLEGSAQVVMCLDIVRFQLQCRR